MTWVRLEVGNNWGSFYYTYPGERLNAFGTCETENALVLTEGFETAVRFPDQWSAVVPLVSKLESYRYSDMGREYSGPTKRWGFEFEVHGLKIWIPLEKVDVAAGFAPRFSETKKGK